MKAVEGFNAARARKRARPA